ncbi:hypothetical protein BDN72DRAFT_633871 [Pluteus cervinus]|uniref:Uncharacterized protein n=1 Tax=Pluteus cervinus TaxID=181527 RepID=A0ACD3BAE4_9AGAR|nr:hypothetical protein BDN72DRAFT_633871 [Pluteus cervinus]
MTHLASCTFTSIILRGDPEFLPCCNMFSAERGDVILGGLLNSVFPAPLTRSITFTWPLSDDRSNQRSCLGVFCKNVATPYPAFALLGKATRNMKAVSLSGILKDELSDDIWLVRRYIGGSFDDFFASGWLDGSVNWIYGQVLAPGCMRWQLLLHFDSGETSVVAVLRLRFEPQSNIRLTTRIHHELTLHRCPGPLYDWVSLGELGMNAGSKNGQMSDTIETKY